MKLLHHELVTGEGGQPRRWLYFLHGIFGAGRNWSSIARRLVRERSDWGAMLVDLRQHGASQQFPPPHTVAAAAADLAALAGTAVPPTAMLGHSFGGKVALLAARLHGIAEHVRQLWIVDSTPAARAPAGGAWQMLRTLQQLPDSFASRAELVANLTDRGIDNATAQWMATNLHHVHGHYRWRFERDAMEALLRSFFDTDAWNTVDNPPPGLELHFLRATRSSVMDDQVLARVRRAADGGAVMLHEIAGGHWLNAENPDSILHLLVQKLPA
jgi:pimeloyl-ACP methyl ester carboxylesterase